MTTAIRSLEACVLRVPLRRPVADASYLHAHWHIPVVEVTTADRLVGTSCSGVWAGDDLTSRVSSP